MPQPLSKYLRKNKNWSITIKPAEIQKRPELASKVAEVIARASSIDYGLAMILVHVLHASPEPAFAMFSEVMDAGNKRAMILAAARSALAADDFESMEAVFSVVRTQIDIRNKFAHWLWGTCEQIKDALVLVEPRYLLTNARRVQQAFSEEILTSEGHQNVMDAMKWNLDKIYIYKFSDLNRILRDFEETQLILNSFITMMNPQAHRLDERILMHFPAHQSLGEQARQIINNQPLFAEALRGIRNRRQKNANSPLR